MVETSKVDFKIDSFSTPHNIETCRHMNTNTHIHKHIFIIVHVYIQMDRGTDIQNKPHTQREIESFGEGGRERRED